MIEMETGCKQWEASHLNGFNRSILKNNRILDIEHAE